MKHLFTLTILALSLLSVNAQDYMDKIAKESCSCVENIENNDDPMRFQMELGLCMINAATPYTKEIKKDYNIDLKYIETQGEELGRVVGLKMAGVCPDVMMKLAQTTEKASPENMTESYIGTVTQVGNDQFVVVSVKNKAGKEVKFFWLTFIKSEQDLVNTYSKLKGKTVEVVSVSQEFFDHRISEYRPFNIIVSLNVLD